MSEWMDEQTPTCWYDNYLERSTFSQLEDVDKPDPVHMQNWEWKMKHIDDYKAVWTIITKEIMSPNIPEKIYRWLAVACVFQAWNLHYVPSGNKSIGDFTFRYMGVRLDDEDKLMDFILHTKADKSTHQTPLDKETQRCWHEGIMRCFGGKEYDEKCSVIFEEHKRMYHALLDDSNKDE